MPTAPFVIRVKVDSYHPSCAAAAKIHCAEQDSSCIHSEDGHYACILSSPFEALLDSSGLNNRGSAVVAHARSVEFSLDRALVASLSEDDVDDSLNLKVWAVLVPPSLIHSTIQDVVVNAKNDDCSTSQDIPTYLDSDEHYISKNRGKIAEGSVMSEVACRDNCNSEQSRAQKDMFLIRVDSVGDSQVATTFDHVLSQIHSSLAGFFVRGIFTTGEGIQSAQKSESRGIVLIVGHDDDSDSALDAVLENIQGESMTAMPNTVIKALSVSRVVFVHQSPLFPTGSVDAPENNYISRLGDGIEAQRKTYPQRGFCAIPSCPSCLHRIDPQRLGMPKSKNNQLCSQFCTTVAPPGNGIKVCCDNSKFLTEWQEQFRCKACRVVFNHWNRTTVTASSAHVGEDMSAALPVATVSNATGDAASSNEGDLDVSDGCSCYKCKMKETLWVCLTCGVVGCGRYSHGHAEEHYNETGHPYSLELVTQRIWDYTSGEFAHRVDLLKCPLMQRRLGKEGSNESMGGGQLANNATGPPSKGGDALSNQLSFESVDTFPSCVHSLPMANILNPDDPSPKKTSMIGEEYEALLQSALEDQAQHYEFEITRLIAELTAKGVDEEKISEKETSEIVLLQGQISDLRIEVDRLSRNLLDAQAQEAGFRATYQRLLREQAVAKDLLEKINEESERERAEGDAHVADLEQQVMDLTANLRMREQIAQNEELSKAQIFGTSGYNSSKPKRGKKIRHSRK